jgi:hypothetical protein
MNNNPNKRSSKSQNKVLLQHLQMGGTITTFEAVNLYGCMRLASRICDLRKMGYGIKGKYITTPTGKRVIEYSMA